MNKEKKLTSIILEKEENIIALVCRNTAILKKIERMYVFLSIFSTVLLVFCIILIPISFWGWVLVTVSFMALILATMNTLKKYKEIEEDLNDFMLVYALNKRGTDNGNRKNIK